MADNKGNNSCCEDFILRRLYECRALEINTQWQRSIFLATFIVLLFTGYGFFFDRVFLQGNDYCVIVHLVGEFLGALIFIFGILWIAIAKGSKRWTDIYEHKIFLREEMSNIETQFRCKIETFLSNYNRYYQKSTCEQDGHKEGSDLSGKIGFWGFSADIVSTARVNIFIGYCIIFIGLVICIIHICCILWGIIPFCPCCLKSFIVTTNLLLLIFAVCGGMLLWFALKHHPYTPSDIDKKQEEREN